MARELLFPKGSWRLGCASPTIGSLWLESAMKRSLTAQVIVAAVLGFAGVAQAEQPTLVVSAYAANVDQYRKDLFDPFERICGCKVVLDLGNTAERLTKLDARKNNPNVDLAVMANYNALEAMRKGLIDKIDVDQVPNYA